LNKIVEEKFSWKSLTGVNPIYCRGTETIEISTDGYGYTENYGCGFTGREYVTHKSRCNGCQKEDYISLTTYEPEKFEIIEPRKMIKAIRKTFDNMPLIKIRIICKDTRAVRNGWYKVPYKQKVAAINEYFNSVKEIIGRENTARDYEQKTSELEDKVKLSFY